MNLHHLFVIRESGSNTESSSYDASSNPTLYNEFSAFAYRYQLTKKSYLEIFSLSLRFGHTLVRNDFTIAGFTGKTEGKLTTTNFKLSDLFFNTDFHKNPKRTRPWWR